MKNIFPPEFIASIRETPGFNEDDFVAIHESGSQVTSIRLNPHKPFTPAFEIDKRIPWSSNGFYLSERPSFTLDPAFHGGAYYVQEASSMFLEEVLRQTCDLNSPLRILDLCAAPGGKSTLIQSLITDTSLLVSNELIKQRVNILSENLSKWGAANVVVSNNAAKDFQKVPGFFDVLVVDAPCSGSGLFRKDPEAIEEWSLSSVEMCSIRQRVILEDAEPALKSGGILIYSTCSYSTEENENISDWLVNEMKMEAIKLVVPDEFGIIESKTFSDAFGYRFFPDKLKGEGFYISAFRKTSNAGFVKHPKVKLQHATDNYRDIASHYVKDIGKLSIIKLKDDLLALPEDTARDMLMLQSILYLKKAGVNLGSVIRNELIPGHELAISNLLSDSLPSANMDLTNALAYLRRMDINLANAEKGWLVVKYNGLALGWVKNLGNRVNNYYPKEWRILNK